MDVEELIFNMYKNEVIISPVFKNEVMKKFGIDLRTASDLYARITNYQIKRFGRRLDDFYEIPTPEEERKVTDNANHRKQKRLGRR